MVPGTVLSAFVLFLLLNNKTATLPNIITATTRPAINGKFKPAPAAVENSPQCARSQPVPATSSITGCPRFRLASPRLANTEVVLLQLQITAGNRDV